MKPRKTISVRSVVDRVNNILATQDLTRDECAMLCTMMEGILFDAGQYNGYWHLRSNEVPNGIEPGIIFDDKEHNHKYPNEYRRRYYMKDNR